MTTPIAEHLYDAAYNGEVAELERLLDGDERLPPGAIDSALDAASYEGWLDAARLLLARGADDWRGGHVAREFPRHAKEPLP